MESENEKKEETHTEHKKEKTITLKESTLWKIGVGVLIILLVAAVWTGGFGLKGGKESAGQQQGKTTLNIPSYVPFLGSASAKLNIIEFGDYQCPYCQLWFKQVKPGVMQDYVNTGKAKFYFMDFAFLGPDSFTLAEGAWCANEQGKYYEYHDYIYANQGQEHSGWATPAKVKAAAQNIAGLDTATFGSCLDGGKYKSRYKELTQLGQSSGVSGTPTIFIGNNKMGYTKTGGYTYSAYQQLIDALLTKA